MNSRPRPPTKWPSARVAALVDAQPNDALRPAGPLRYQGPAFVSELPSAPWCETAEWPWTSVLESAWRDIRAEFEKNAADATSQEYNKPFDIARHSESAPSVSTSGTWDAVFLRRHGNWVKRNSELFPLTCEVLAQAPLGSGEILFSILGPRERIAPHSSGCNVVVTCHLPLVVPDDCGINVAGVTRQWTEGILLAFDDSWVHRAWNNAAEPRVVLLWDVWHPSLTHSEIRALEELLPHLLPDV